MNKKRYHRYTKEQHEFLKRECVGISRQELTDRFNKEFGLDLPLSKIVAICSYKKYSSGLDGKFQVNKKADNERPIGSKRVNKKGYTYIKVGKDEWKTLHQILWESYYGEVPDDHVIIFLDQNKSNISIGNLKLVKKNNLVGFANNHLRSKHAKLNESLLNIIEIDRLIK